jgi:hypothetical protein
MAVEAKSKKSKKQCKNGGIPKTQLGFSLDQKQTRVDVFTTQDKQKYHHDEEPEFEEPVLK